MRGSKKGKTSAPPDRQALIDAIPSVGQRRLDHFRVHCFGHGHWFVNLVENGTLIETGHRSA
jgi:hypothetical protein